jgi:CO/xanthine dehydrogenase Mo-binding subunit
MAWSAATNGEQVAYWGLGSMANPSTVRPQAKLKPKPAHRHRYIGHPVHRVDLTPKMLGQAMFVQEQRPAGMLFGHIVRPPTYQAKLLSVNLAAVQKMPGVVKLVRNGSSWAWWPSAKNKRWPLPKPWPPRPSGRWTKSCQDMMAFLSGCAKPSPTNSSIPKRNCVPVASPVAKTMQATYQRPYHMHASIGTSAAIATMGADGVMLIQTHSQSVFETSVAIAKMLGMEPAKVRCQHMQGAGCYGHNLADDAAADAALLAAAVPGQPVRLQYTREQEHTWEPYGSAMEIQVQAGLDAQGNVLDWDLQVWSTPHGTRPSGEPGNLLSARYLEKPFTLPVPVNGGPPNYAADRNAIALYDFPSHKVLTHFITDMPLRASSTRGLGAYANVFAIESFIDELAAAAKVDPVEYRLRFLKDERARDALVKAAKAFGWADWKKTEGRGRGIAFARYKNIAGYCAVALEVEVNRRNGRIRVLRAVASADVGHIVNPDGVRATKSRAA